MNRKFIIAVAIVSITLALAGCPHQTDVYNVDNATVVANVSNVSSAQVRKAIIRAGGGQGWVIRDAGPGELEGILHLRVHTAKIRIPYNSRSYSLIYKDSTNLYYENGKIHRNYNVWIQNLHQAIQVQLSML